MSNDRQLAGPIIEACPTFKLFITNINKEENINGGAEYYF